MTPTPFRDDEDRPRFPISGEQVVAEAATIVLRAAVERADDGLTPAQRVLAEHVGRDLRGVATGLRCELDRLDRMALGAGDLDAEKAHDLRHIIASALLVAFSLEARVILAFMQRTVPLTFRDLGTPCAAEWGCYDDAALYVASVIATARGVLGIAG